MSGAGEDFRTLVQDCFFSRTPYFSEPYNDNLAKLYGGDAYHSKRLIELKEQIKYEAHFVGCSRGYTDELCCDDKYWDEFYLSHDMDEPC